MPAGEDKVLRVSIARREEVWPRSEVQKYTRETRGESPKTKQRNVQSRVWRTPVRRERARTAQRSRCGVVMKAVRPTNTIQTSRLRIERTRKLCRVRAKRDDAEQVPAYGAGVRVVSCKVQAVEAGRSDRLANTNTYPTFPHANRAC